MTKRTVETHRAEGLVVMQKFRRDLTSLIRDFMLRNNASWEMQALAQIVAESLVSSAGTVAAADGDTESIASRATNLAMILLRATGADVREGTPEDLKDVLPPQRDNPSVN